MSAASSFARMVKARAMVLKTVVPGVLSSAREQELLEEDLRCIGYHELLEKPWNVQWKEMMVELMGEKDNQWEGTIRHASERWTVTKWQKVYGFPRQGEGMALRTDRFIDGKFSTCVNPKHGFAVVECKDVRARRVLEFLVPLLYPGKPSRVTITVENTIFGALSGERPMDWRVVVRDVV